MATSRTKNLEEHGKVQPKSSLSLRGRAFVGTVISAKMQKTVTVEWERKHFLKKYERYEISKTKNFIVVEVLGKERGFKERMEAEEESKSRKPAKEEKSKEENAKTKPSNRVGNAG